MSDLVSKEQQLLDHLQSPTKKKTILPPEDQDYEPERACARALLRQQERNTATYKMFRKAYQVLGVWFFIATIMMVVVASNYWTLVLPDFRIWYSAHGLGRRIVEEFGSYVGSQLFDAVDVLNHGVQFIFRWISEECRERS